MSKRLDRQNDELFNEELNLLRCSMHGFLHDPKTGECLSNLCQGDRLCALALLEWDGRIYSMTSACPLCKKPRASAR